MTENTSEYRDALNFSSVSEYTECKKWCNEKGISFQGVSLCGVKTEDLDVHVTSPCVPTPLLWRVIADNDDDMPTPRLSVAKRAWRLLDKWGDAIIVAGFSIYAFIRIISIVISLQ